MKASVFFCPSLSLFFPDPAWAITPGFEDSDMQGWGIQTECLSVCLEMFVQVELVMRNTLDSLDREQEARTGQLEGNVGRTI